MTISIKKYLNSFKGKLTALVVIATLFPLIISGIIQAHLFDKQFSAICKKQLTTGLETFSLILSNKQDNLTNGINRIASDNTLQITIDLEIIPQLKKYIKKQLDVLQFGGIIIANNKNEVIASSGLSIQNYSDKKLNQNSINLISINNDLLLVYSTKIIRDNTHLGYAVGIQSLKNNQFLTYLSKKLVNDFIIWINETPEVSSLSIKSINKSDKYAQNIPKENIVSEFNINHEKFKTMLRTITIGQNKLSYGLLLPMKDLNKNFQLMLLIILCAIIVIFIVIMFFLRHFMKELITPVTELTQAANSVGKINKELPGLNYNRKDEFGVLNRTFRDMHKSLNNYIQSIKEKNKILGEHSNTIEQQNIELLKLDKMKDDFLANTTHELKTPLNGILGVTSSILNGKYGDIQSAINSPLKMIYTSGERLLALVEKILTFSKISISNEKTEVSASENINIADILSDIISKVEFDATINKTVIKKDFSNDIFLKSNPEMLLHIFQNLISNAVKFTINGIILIKVENIYDKNNNKCINIIVEDTGVGIIKEEQEKIFDKFYQGFQSESRKFEGSGIGLSIVKDCVKSLNGIVRLLSKEKQGTHFSIIIPVQDQTTQPSLPFLENFLIDEQLLNEIKLKQHNIAKENNAVVNTDTCAKDDSNNNKMKILVVDDDEINREVVRSKLADTYRIDLAENGIRCISMANKLLPDLILLDIMMPEMSGYEVIKRLKMEKRTKDIPIICLSAKTQISSIQKAINLGAMDYVSKPFHEEELIVRIETQLKQKKLIENIKEALKVKTEFLTTMSHEIRTPMNAIAGFIGLFLNMDLNEKQRECLEYIKSASDSLMNIIEDILNFTEIDSGKLALKDEAFDICDMSYKLITLFKTNAEIQGLKIISTIPDAESLPRNVKGDINQLNQVLINLLNNSMKFTKKGLITLSLGVEWENKDTVCFKFTVTDTGIGVPSDKKKIIFDAFSQADGSLTREFGGTGLGLAISNKLIQKMGGKLWVESPVNPNYNPETSEDTPPGSSFHFTIVLLKKDSAIHE
ncbi:MAG: hypothetical protein B6I31_01350 [Desulfobacteraceae bacterium 4572_19]|nr:MAG: hypothetical protein B6I31_01350 [Desulfobacteraceae bacterium 4572_19]